MDTSDLPAKKDFVALSKVEKLDINKFPISLNNLKTKVDDLDVEIKNLSDLVANEVVKNIKFNIPKTKVNSLEKKIPDATTLI